MMLAFGLYRWFQHLAYQAQGLTTLRLKLDRKIHYDKLKLLMSTKKQSYEVWDIIIHHHHHHHHPRQSPSLLPLSKPREDEAVIEESRHLPA
jgi:hypothetical protein